MNEFTIGVIVPLFLRFISAPMAEFVRQANALEKVFLGSQVHGALGLVRGCHEVKSAVIASTTVKCLTDSWDTTLDITGIFCYYDFLFSDNHVQTGYGCASNESSG